MTSTEHTRIPTESTLKLKVSGCRIFPTAVFNREKPTWMTRKATTEGRDIFHAPVAKGCSSSAGFFCHAHPDKSMMEDAASDKLLKASAITEILFTTSPANSLPPNSSRLQQIPVMLASIP